MAIQVGRELPRGLARGPWFVGQITPRRGIEEHVFWAFPPERLGSFAASSRAERCAKGDVSFPLRVSGEDVLLHVLVKPRASKSQIRGVIEEELSIQLAAPPVDGAANAELLKVLAKTLAVPKSRLVIERGDASRHKVVRILGVSIARIAHALGVERLS